MKAYDKRKACDANARQGRKRKKPTRKTTTMATKAAVEAA
jgi:hypothetical protein